jgi:hypothetical protein
VKTIGTFYILINHAPHSHHLFAGSTDSRYYSYGESGTWNYTSWDYNDDNYDSYYTTDLCADDNLTFSSKWGTGFVAFWLTFAAVVVAIWMIVSFIGCTCGFMGAKAEKDAPPDIEAGAARPTGAPQGTAIPAQVVIVQGQPTAASGVVPPQRAVGEKQNF